MLYLFCAGFLKAPAGGGRSSDCSTYSLFATFASLRLKETLLPKTGLSFLSSSLSVRYSRDFRYNLPHENEEDCFASRTDNGFAGHHPNTSS